MPRIDACKPTGERGTGGATMGAIEQHDVESIEQAPESIEHDGPKSGARARVDAGDETCPGSVRRPRQRTLTREKKVKEAHERKAARDTYGGINVGERIRDIRLGRGLSLEMMHKRGAPTPSMLSSIERGLANSTVGTLANIARALGVPLFQLFTGDDECSLILRGMHDADFDRLRFVLTGK